MEKEKVRKIVAAAIFTPDREIVSLPAPARHHNIIRHIVDNMGYDSVGYGFEQGFIDNDGVFLRRKPAARIAKKAGQIEELAHPPNLYSEDLW